MPRLPKFGRNSRIGMDVQATPSQSVSQAGAVNRAGANLADQVGRLGEQVGKQRALADLKSDQLDFETKLSETRTKNKQQNDVAFAGTDHRGYSAKLLENEDFEAQRMIEEASPFSKNHLKNLYANQRKGLAAKYSNEENRKRLDYQYGNALNNIDTMANNLSENPDKAELIDGINNLENYNNISGVLYSPARQQALKARTGALADAALTSLTEGDMNGLLVAKSWLNNDDPASQKIRSTMTPQRIKAFNRVIDAKILKARKLDMAKTTYNLQQDALEYEGKVLANTATDLDVIALKERIDSARKKAVNNADLFEQSKSLEKAASLMQSAVNNKEFADELRVMDIKDVAKMDVTEGGIDPKDPSGSMRDMQYKAKYKQKYLDAWNKDAGAMAKMERKDLIEGSQDFIQYQIEKGVSNPSYMSNAKRDMVHDSLVNSPNPGKTYGDFVNSFADGNGQKALAQATGKYPDLSKFVVAGELSSPLTRARILSLDKKSVTEAFKNNGNTVDTLKTAINNDLWKEYSVSMGNNSKFISGVRELVEVDVMDQVNRGVEMETAVNRSIKRVISDNYTQIEAHNTNIFLPNQANVHPQDAQGFLERYGNPNNKSGLVDLFKDNGFKLSDQPGVDPSLFSGDEDFVEAIYDTGDFQYAMSSDRSGWKPHYIGDSGLPKAIKVRNSDDKLIDLVIPFKDISAGGSLNQEVLEQINRNSELGGLEKANPDAARRLRENIKKFNPNRFVD